MGYHTSLKSGFSNGFNLGLGLKKPVFVFPSSKSPNPRLLHLQWVLLPALALQVPGAGRQDLGCREFWGYIPMLPLVARFALKSVEAGSHGTFPEPPVQDQQVQPDSCTSEKHK